MDFEQRVLRARDELRRAERVYNQARSIVRASEETRLGSDHRLRIDLSNEWGALERDSLYEKLRVVRREIPLGRRYAHFSVIDSLLYRLEWRGVEQEEYDSWNACSLAELRRRFS